MEITFIFTLILLLFISITGILNNNRLNALEHTHNKNQIRLMKLENPPKYQIGEVIDGATVCKCSFNEVTFQWEYYGFKSVGKIIKIN